ncbi:hypothetical protein CN645_34825 [Burkholderia sp. IDO3]|nr:hypothetical protein DCN14_26315 [Burkholderia sp. IDO3]PCD57334.1 hypothetical protein CN645_34825 [Burkholderia sp. IDO3]
MPLHFRDGGRERVAAGQGRRGQRSLRSGGERGGGPRWRRGDGLSSMLSYNMVRLRSIHEVAGLPGNCSDIGECHEAVQRMNHIR